MSQLAVLGHWRLPQDMDDLPKLTTRTFVGIVVAISGNVLISLALNLQKLAHKRAETNKLSAHNRLNNGRIHRISEGPSLDENDEDREYHISEDVFLVSGPPANSELQPLSTPRAERGYGSASPNPHETRRPPIFRLPFRSKQSRKAPLIPPATGEAASPQEFVKEERNEGEYLKSKLWWCGFLLMNVGETGNFISYAFAPASVVAPLGTFALMANCFFAPIIQGERFRMRDLLGVAIAIVGAVTVVLASNASDARLDPEALVHALSQIPFIVFTSVYVASAIVLATLSEGIIGRTWVVVDIGLCALFGGFTVLSTKALSTLLTLEWLEVFAQWITYPLFAVLLLTGVGQIKYLNRALMRFDSKVVIPIQFVLFTLSAIIGSAILYGDFQKATFHQLVTFIYGCAATFCGVFVIAWAPNPTTNQELSQDDRSEGVVPDVVVSTRLEGSRSAMGTLGRKPIHVLPSRLNDLRDTPTLRRKRSSISLMGISPAQHLLLVHTPPRDIPVSHLGSENGDLEFGIQTPDPYERQRAMTWYESERSDERSRSMSRTRDGGFAGKFIARVGSLDGQTSHR
ncbi:uncharacterized protein LACBIDRAFT_311981 [Laccaria bicolor S238N-H82]|uniref:Predicted protein n=1 Tax=Laccaria bicolor (strain S238N-H82 / ATCC MYA-4686) TaxID=486041 RepID=B0CYS8_LACBS|nr:uncharacterized protein LACBIDRAFT_311981 [Laccaria bicolor S238N-H82]EDR12935.1 predicted protein [Laccaria bicolor S238N-H82]|eukprot:XP_001877199.1 predicted protein [Laccaria bicolor S238N-H82]